MLRNKRRWKKGKYKGATMFKRKKRKEKEEEDKNIKQWKKKWQGQTIGDDVATSCSNVTTTNLSWEGEKPTTTLQWQLQPKTKNKINNVFEETIIGGKLLPS